MKKLEKKRGVNKIMPTIEFIIKGLESGGARVTPYVPKRDWPDTEAQVIGVAVELGSSSVILLQGRRDLFKEDGGLNNRLQAMGQRFAAQDIIAQKSIAAARQDSPRK